MRKFMLVGGAVLASLAIGVPAAEASSNFCQVKSPNGNRVACTATTVDRGADFARVRMGLRTRGVWSLRCEVGNHVSSQRGILRRNGAVTIPIGLHGNPTCVLSARGWSKRRAVVRVSLV